MPFKCPYFTILVGIYYNDYVLSISIFFILMKYYFYPINLSIITFIVLQRFFVFWQTFSVLFGQFIDYPQERIAFLLYFLASLSTCIISPTLPFLKKCGQFILIHKVIHMYTCSPTVFWVEATFFPICRSSIFFSHICPRYYQRIILELSTLVMWITFHSNKACYINVLSTFCIRFYLVINSCPQNCG